MTMTPSRPYLIRAIYEWLIDNGATPHLVVDVEKPNVVVPEEHIQDGHITLDLTPTAIGGLVMQNDHIRFQAGFGGILRDLYIPMNAVRGLYGQENGKGMFFDDEEYAGIDTEIDLNHQTAFSDKQKAPIAPKPLAKKEGKNKAASVEKKRPTLTIVK